MKNRNLILLLALLMGVVSCSESFLEREPYGSTLTQKQYENLSGTLEGSMRGIYAMLYTKTSTSHDEFGKRSIDLFSDLLSSDMALTAYSYGWFYTDENLQSNIQRTSYTWTYYYKMLRNINMVVSVASTRSETEGEDGVVTKIAKYGVPTAHARNSSKETIYYTISATGDTLCSFTEAEADIASCYAQALTMRGYVYSNMINLYSPTTDVIFDQEGSLAYYSSVPLYNENNMNSPQGYSKVSELYTQVESDLITAIDYFEAFSETTKRSSDNKLEVDINVARSLLAYSYLNKANRKAASTSDSYKLPYQNALKYAKQVIESGEYRVIPNASVWSTGFNNVSDASWIWGQEVVTETATGLASWFGQVDIHSYSYAWAGDTKVIDENLYNEIPSFDARKRWFNDGSANSTFKLCPDGKFFSAKSPVSTKSDDIDREWLSDNVFMRVESDYLIAAEASFRLGEYDEAKKYLQAITDQRVDTAAGAQAAYQNYIDNLTSANMLSAIEYNWRVEMWGEGYGLQTFRRLSPETTGNTKRRRGGNHCALSGTEIDATADQYTFRIPSSETSYNPILNQ